MKRAFLREHGRGSLDLIEEALLLVRRAPAGTWLVYYLGGLPFVLGGLFFWADMSRNPYAERHAAGAALGLAFLFVWMKGCQSLYAARLRDQAVGAAPRSISWHDARRAILYQTILQPSGLFVLPVAALTVLPLGWVVAFYQNLTVLAAGEVEGVRRLLRRAGSHSALWSRQNHALLAVLAGFTAMVFVNGLTLGFALPQLVKALFGVDSVFTQSPWAALNSTFLMTIAGLTYLAVDPLVKAVYVLRCFYGDSLTTGADLRAALRSVRVPATAVRLGVAGGLLLLAAGAGPHATASSGATGREPALPEPKIAAQAPHKSRLGARVGDPQRVVRGRAWQSRERNRGPNRLRLTEPRSGTAVFMGAGQFKKEQVASQASVAGTAEPRQPSGAAGGPIPDAAALDQSIRDVLGQRKFVWRLPRSRPSEDEEPSSGFAGRVLDRMRDLLDSWSQTLRGWIERWLDWLLTRRRAEGRPGWGLGGITPVHAMLGVVLAVVLAAFVLLILRLRRRGAGPAVASAQPMQAIVDVADERLGADTLPEEGWMQLGDELLNRGETRLAIRALYLAGLAHLARRGLLGLARHKSNREYLRELSRRSHVVPQLVARFGSSVTTFDQVWYGLRPVDAETARAFAANLEQMRGAS